jgi:predicted DNA-binding transcriptional regulator AlpA
VNTGYAELNEELMMVGDVAQFLQVKNSWIYGRTRRRGKARLPHIKLGKYLRFRKAEILRWLEELQES